MGWITELARSTFRHWWALLSCAVFTLFGTLVLMLQESNQWVIRTSFILSGLLLIVAIALAWRDEHKKLLEEMARCLFRATNPGILPGGRDVLIVAAIPYIRTIAIAEFQRLMFGVMGIATVPPRREFDSRVSGFCTPSILVFPPNQ